MRWVVVLVFPLVGGSLVFAQSPDVRAEESADYYHRWLEEDVAYLITEEERDVFLALSTDEERERFIEEFWRRRDPDPRTPENEFKTEHYRRIAYANEHFTAAVPGWQSDRGRIYIIHGPPDAVEKHPGPGHYERPPHEGGGSTQTYPFEVWFYREMEGVGTNVELEFVDVSLTGEYRLVADPTVKDALLFVPGAGATLAEEMGLATKADRPRFSPGNRERYPLMPRRAQDSPFHRYETYALAQRPKQLRHPELRELVTARVNVEQLPLQVEPAYFRLDTDRYLALVYAGGPTGTPTVPLLQELWFYGRVTDLGGRIVAEFEDEWTAAAPVPPGDAFWQKTLVLSYPGPYKLELVVREPQTERWSVYLHKLEPPRNWKTSTPSAAPILLAADLVPGDAAGGPTDPWLLGDWRVRPRIGGLFHPAERLGVYLQLYGLSFDAATAAPELLLQWRICRGESVVFQRVDAAGRGVRYWGPDRTVVVEFFPLEDLPAGEYRLEVVARDRIAGTEVAASRSFRVGGR
ncbi:MAG: hypothetical protein Kow00109_19180 [Acidobacteriota bacterium]